MTLPSTFGFCLIALGLSAALMLVSAFVHYFSTRNNKYLTKPFFDHPTYLNFSEYQGFGYTPSLFAASLNFKKKI